MLVAVGGAWTAFAQENGAPELEPPGPFGRSLFSFISDPTTAQLFDDLLARVRQRGSAIAFPIRCDSPSTRRYLRTTIATSGAGYSLTSVVLRAEARVPIELCRGDGEPGIGTIRSCGWCKRIEVEEGWVELEVAMERLAVFTRAQAPLMSHGMCGGCMDRLQRILGAA